MDQSWVPRLHAPYVFPDFQRKTPTTTRINVSQDLLRFPRIARRKRIFAMEKVYACHPRQAEVRHYHITLPPHQGIAYEKRSMFLTKHRVRQKEITIALLILPMPQHRRTQNAPDLLCVC